MERPASARRSRLHFFAIGLSAVLPAFASIASLRVSFRSVSSPAASPRALSSGFQKLPGTTSLAETISVRPGNSFGNGVTIVFFFESTTPQNSRGVVVPGLSFHFRDSTHLRWSTCSGFGSLDFHFGSCSRRPSRFHPVFLCFDLSLHSFTC